jgi:hypothetical protein
MIRYSRPDSSFYKKKIPLLSQRHVEPNKFESYYIACEESFAFAYTVSPPQSFPSALPVPPAVVSVRHTKSLPDW